MKNLRRYGGTLLRATGIGHSLVGLIVGWLGHEAIVRAGVVDAPGYDLGRQSAFWFLVCGIVLVIVGVTLQYFLKITGRPASAFPGCRGVDSSCRRR